ncbi:MAG: redoxin domain-containing protein [Prevotella sp.]
MKKTILSLLCMIVVALDANAQGYTLKGTLSGLADGTKVVLIPMSHDSEDPIAETTISGGKFEMSGNVEFPRCVFLQVKGTYGMADLMLENTNITFSANTSKEQAFDGTDRYNFTDVKVSGSPLTDKLYGYLARRNALDKDYADYHARFADFSKQMGEARQAKDKARIDSLNATETAKAYAQAEKEFFTKVEKTFNDMINSNLDSYWGPLLTLRLYSYLTPEQAALYNSFSEEAKQSWYGKKVRSEVFPGGQKGEKVKEFTVKDDNGKEISLAELCKGKKYVLIDFWASWCAPCRKEIPNVKHQYELYKAKGFEVISISIDKNPEAWRKAVKEEQLQWPNFIDCTNVSKVYNVRSVPSMFLIDVEDMTIIASGNDARGEALATKLAELFK